MRTLHIGLSEEQRTGAIVLLDQALSNASLLVIKTKKVHWDIVGPQFLTLHKLLDEHYEKVTEFADKIAERVRQLGGYPVGTAAGFIKSATIKEAPGEVSAATGAIAMLLDDHEAIIRNLRASAQTCEETHKDRGTADFLVAIMQAHEEMAWMLRSLTEGSAVRSDGRVDLPEATTHTQA